MPKRSKEEKIERYRKKIRKLQENKKTYRRRIIESDDEDENQCYLESPSEACINIQEPQDNDISIPNDELVQNLLNDCPTEAKSAENISADPPNLEEPSLDPELLSALGETESDSPEYGEKILDSQAKLWLPILKKGVPKEAKDKLLKEYAVPDNCRLLQAPKLNAEIAAALPDMVRNRDKSSLLAQQQQLGLGITACNRALDLLLLNGDKVQAIKHLSNSCRLLSDLHFMYTQNRIKLITPSLDKTCLNVINDAERDSTLFGEKLGENIKAAKAIEKQGLQIKKGPTQKAPVTYPQQAGARPSYQGNWQSPRFQSNRGGRGGNRRHPPAPQMRRNNQTNNTKNAQQSKPRAPAQQ
ncbi:uncharacterized protein LOC135087999 [Ostrinia nubilalis]|uniref:uncharacterized protein LOC135087999 n=1 Tax=Ostrinia nubilalis TaxID=29057 RepID=UPI0030824B73